MSDMPEPLQTEVNNHYFVFGVVQEARNLITHSCMNLPPQICMQIVWCYFFSSARLFSQFTISQAFSNEKTYVVSESTTLF